MMNLVVNASPMILLGKVGRVDLLSKLCDSVFVPEGVVAEISVDAEDTASRTLESCTWLRRVSVSIPDSIMAWDLGRGESEVISYALLQPGYRPLLDDAEGKACALAFGLKPLGTGGLLVLAKRAGLLHSVRIVLDDMRAKGLWLSDAVYKSILQIAGEETER